MNSIAKPEGFVGLDYHDRKVQVCVVDRQGRRLLDKPLDNEWQAIRTAAESVCRVGGAAIEACTGSANLAEELLEKVGWSIHLAHPGYVSRMRHNPDKTDFSDAHLLADLERVGYLPQVWLASRYIRQLRVLIRYRQGLVDQRKAVKLQIRALLRNERVHTRLSAWTQGWWRWLEQVWLGEQTRWVLQRHCKRLEQLATEIGEVKQRLELVTADDPVVARLQEQPQIGPVTAWWLRAQIGTFERFGRGKQLARFCGLSPRNASSGERQADGGLVAAGSPGLRRCLMELAHRLMRQAGPWRDLASQLRERGKPTCVVVAAVANRYMRWLWHQMVPAPAPLGGGGAGPTSAPAAHSPRLADPSEAGQAA
jgi:transposase